MLLMGSWVDLTLLKKEPCTSRYVSRKTEIERGIRNQPGGRTQPRDEQQDSFLIKILETRTLVLR